MACASEEHIASIFRMTLKIETTLPQGEDNQEENLPYICNRKTTDFASPPCLQLSNLKNIYILNILLFSDDLDTDKRVLLKWKFKK